MHGNSRQKNYRGANKFQDREQMVSINVHELMRLVAHQPFYQGPPFNQRRYNNRTHHQPRRDRRHQQPRISPFKERSSSIKKPFFQKSFIESDTRFQSCQQPSKEDFTRYLDFSSQPGSHQSKLEKIRELEEKLRQIKLPEEPIGAIKLFENKMFNQVKSRMPHLPTKDIQELIVNKWKNGIRDEEREEFYQMAEAQRKAYFQTVQDLKMQENELRSQIHELRHGGQNEAIKPTGKLRFLTAYRFYRRDEIPKIKESHPLLEGRDRHQLVKKRWRLLSQEEKYPYVLMSRADEERAKFCSKIALIRNNLLSEIGPVQQSSGVVCDVLTKINQVIEDNNPSDVDDDASSSASLCCAGDHD